MGNNRGISLRERIRLNLVAAMESAGLTQVQLADELGISKGTVNNWIRGNNSPDVDMVPRICNALNIPISFLYAPTASEPAETGRQQITPSDLSEEAKKIAKDYDNLDDHGKGAVKAILAYEGKAAPAEPRKEQEQPAVISYPKAKKNHGIVQINVYDQPAAAGLGNYLDEPDYHIEQYPDAVIPPKADFGIIISGDSMEPKIHDGGTVFVQAAPVIDAGKIGIFILNGQAYCKKLVVDHGSRQVRLVSLNPKYADIVIAESDNLRTVGRVLGQWTKGQPQDIFGW